MGRYSGGSSSGGAKTGAPTFETQALTSRSITFTRSGRARLVIVGAGGSGAKSSGGFSTGGNSAPWGVKEFDVASGDTLVLNMGAQAVGVTTSGANGNAGGTTTAVLNGTTIMTVNGGEGGLLGSNPAAASATVTGADYWVGGQAAGTATSLAGTVSGGAAVDASGMGLGRSPNASSNTGPGGSVGSNFGGKMPLPFDFSQFGFSSGDWVASGSPGRGQAIYTDPAPGPFGGSASTANTGTISSEAGIGAGSGAAGSSASSSGNGGKAYAYLTFTAS